MATPFTATYLDLDPFEVYQLARSIHGEVITPNGTAYETTRRVWNGAVDHSPAVIVRPASAQDVSQAVRFARRNGLAISVRSGGHNSAGLAVADGGLMLDLSSLKGLEIDAERRVVRAEPGLTLGEIVPALAEQGFAAVTGTCAGTGLGGSTLGGGIGWLAGKYGMAIDNLLAVEIVTADGRVLRASAEEHADLFWAVRGGGGNFGVVTALELRIHRQEMVLGGMLAYPLADAAEVLRHYRELRARSGDELGALVIFATFPGVGPALMIQLCYSGTDLLAGAELLAPLRTAVTPALDTIQPMPYGAFFMAYTPPVPAGRHYYETACSLDTLSDEAISVLLESTMRLPTPLSSIVLHELHGAAARVAPNATAFALRRPHLMVMHAAGWEDNLREQRVAWADQSLEALEPYAAPGLYVNFMDKGSATEIQVAYGANYRRLAQIKAMYDPHNTFRLNQNIEPAA